MTTLARGVKRKITATGTRGFLQWLQASQPAVYKRIQPKLAKQANSTLRGLGLTAPDLTQTASTSTAPKSWTDSLKDLVMVASQAYLTKEQLKNQERVMNLQLQRAQQGLPPLDIDLSQYGVPQAQVNVGVAGDTKKLLIFGGIGLAVLFLGSRLLGSAR